MKSKVISNKRNIFGIIKETVFGSMADFFRTLGSTDEDEIQEEVVTPDEKAGVAEGRSNYFKREDRLFLCYSRKNQKI